MCAVTTVGVHSCGGRCAPSAFTDGTDGPRGVSRLDARRRVERASPCVRPAARALPGVGAGGEGGCADGWAAVRESVTLAGRAERARVARAFVSGVLGPGHPCGDVAVLLVSELFGNSCPAQRLGCSRGDGHGRGQGRGRHCPGRGHRPRRARGAGAAPCWQRRGRRPGAPARRGPRRAVGLAAARRADRDLVRTHAGLSRAYGPGVSLLPTSHVPGLYLPSTWSCRQAAGRRHGRRSPQPGAGSVRAPQARAPLGRSVRAVRTVG